MRNVKILSIVFLSTYFSFSGILAAQQSLAAPRIVERVDESHLTVLKGNTHPLARVQYDTGTSAPDLPMQRMLLVLKRSPEQQYALTSLLDQQQDKASPSYHKWLTPEEFGAKFGPSDQDIQVVTGWLQSHGFQIARVAKGRVMIEFSGTAAQVQEAFHTEIHKYAMNGEEHWANANDPSIPTALTPVVHGIFTLHNFVKKPHSHISAEPFTAKVGPGGVPDFNSSSGKHFLAPADYAIIYGFDPNYTGAGATIALVARSNINTADISNFQSLLHVPSQIPTVVVDGADPLDLQNGDEFEADLDTTWAGAVAQGANVVLVVSASSFPTDGIDLSELYIIDNNLADVMSESYGSCETGRTDSAGISLLAEQAAAQGISYTVSTGDSGSAGCDDPHAETAAQGGAAVSILAATPFNIAVGGTMFNELANGGSDSTYWNATNAQNTYQTAKSYIPEDVWNESCTTCANPNHNLGTGSIWAGGGGSSALFITKPSWQTGFGDNSRDLPDVSLTSASHDDYFLCLASGGGSCVQDNTGSFQFFGVYGTSAAAPSFAGILAMAIQEESQRLGTHTRLGQANYVLYRLFSADTPHVIFNDITVGNTAVPGEVGGGYGTANPLYPATTGYDLATGLGSVNVKSLLAKWKSATFSASATTLTLTPPAAPIIHGKAWGVAIHVTKSPTGTGPTGDTSLIASAGSTSPGIGPFALANGSFSGSTGLLSGGTYSVHAHYAGDEVYGASDSIGAPVTILPEPSSTTLTFLGCNADCSNLVSVTSVAYGNFEYVRVQVAGQSGQGYPSGMVTFTDSLAGAASGSYPLNSRGSAEAPNGFYNLPAGSHSITASYGGDGSFKASASAASILTITAAPTTSAVTATPSGIASGTAVSLTASITTNSAGDAPTGTVSFYSNGVLLGSPVTVSGTAAVFDNANGTYAPAKAVASFNPVLAAQSSTARGFGWWSTSGIALAFVFFAGTRPKARRSIFTLLVCATGLAWVGCGGGGGGTKTVFTNDTITAIYSGDNNYANSSAPGTVVSVSH